MEPVGWIMAAASALSAIGAIQQGNAAKNAAEYNARVAENNATTARQQAGAREEQIRRQARQVLGAQRAALAQAGAGLGGSAADIEEQSAIAAELDALNARYEGELNARGLMAQAELDRYQGRQARRQGYLGAGSALLSGAAGVYRGYKVNPKPAGTGG